MGLCGDSGHGGKWGMSAGLWRQKGTRGSRTAATGMVPRVVAGTLVDCAEREEPRCGVGGVWCGTHCTRGGLWTPWGLPIGQLDPESRIQGAGGKNPEGSVHTAEKDGAGGQFQVRRCTHRWAWNLWGGTSALDGGAGVGSLQPEEIPQEPCMPHTPGTH